MNRGAHIEHVVNTVRFVKLKIVRKDLLRLHLPTTQDFGHALLNDRHTLLIVATLLMDQAQARVDGLIVQADGLHETGRRRTLGHGGKERFDLPFEKFHNARFVA